MGEPCPQYGHGAGPGFGHRVDRLPGGWKPCCWRGSPTMCLDGIFYRQQENHYVVVAPPLRSWSQRSRASSPGSGRPPLLRQGGGTTTSGGNRRALHRGAATGGAALNRTVEQIRAGALAPFHHRVFPLQPEPRTSGRLMQGSVMVTLSPLCAVARLDGSALQGHRLAGDGEPEPVALAHAG